MLRKMSKAITLIMVEEWNIETRDNFACLGEGKRTYTRSQNDFTLSLVDNYGVRATSRILQIPPPDNSKVVQKVWRASQAVPILGL